MTVVEAPRVSRTTVLTAEQASRWYAELREARDEWTERAQDFYTLGAATYLDVCRGGRSMHVYRRIADRANRVLQRRFGALLGAVRRALEKLVDRRCRLTDALAVPGFHIFEGSSLSRRRRDNLHVDLQFARLPVDVDLDVPTLTFTLPLALPTEGAGIEFCDHTRDRPWGRLVVERYRVGELLVHSGRALHRRAHFPFSDACVRVTLQGHALLIRNEWILYW